MKRNKRQNSRIIMYLLFLLVFYFPAFMWNMCSEHIRHHDHKGSVAAQHEIIQLVTDKQSSIQPVAVHRNSTEYDFADHVVNPEWIPVSVQPTSIIHIPATVHAFTPANVSVNKTSLYQSRACPIGYAELPTDERWTQIKSTLFKRRRSRKIVYFTVFDCEEWMLEIKLAEMSASVYLFVIGEAAYSNTNQPRTQCFPQILARNPRIAQYKSQILYFYMEERVTTYVQWEAEVLYKNSVGHRFANNPLSAELADDDLAIFTDLDEIFTRKFLEVLRDYDGFSPYIQASMRWSYYGFQWVNPNPTTVNVGVTWETLRNAGHNTNNIRFSLMGHQPTQPIFDGVYVGWHCSWCLHIDQFIRKIEHSSALELNTDYNKRLEFLQDMRTRGLWFYDQQPNGCYADVDSASFAPEYVLRNMEYFNIITGK